MKKFFYLSFLFLFSSFFGVELFAQNTLSIDDITIEPGETKSVSINFENTADYVVAFDLNMKFPTWVTVKNPKIVAARTNDTGTPDLSFTDKGSGLWGLWYTSSDSELYWITGNSGAVFTFDLVCDGSATIGDEATVTMTLKEMYDVNLDEVSYTFPDFKITVATAATVDITLANTSDYNSYCSDKDLDFSTIEDQAEAYVVSDVTATTATLTKVTKIPAGEGFLILGKGTANISVPVAATTPTATGTKLKGVTAATAIEAGNFILSSDGTKFVPCTAGTLPANKAYLPKSEVPASAKEFLMIVDETVVTGISGVQAENNANGPIYNLNGSRVSNPQKGVYIMNGRKVIVK